MDKKNTGGEVFASLLQIAFIVLKLTGVIDWSWWWVLSPLWILVGLAFICLIVIIIMAIKKGADIKW